MSPKTKTSVARLLSLELENITVPVWITGLQSAKCFSQEKEGWFMEWDMKERESTEKNG
jgi:hypothetical protein